MTTLTIADLSCADQLDHQAMRAVRGGMLRGIALPVFGFSKTDVNFAASQELGQSQNTLVNNGNNVAFASGITSTVEPHQTGTNTINFR